LGSGQTERALFSGFALWSLIAGQARLAACPNDPALSLSAGKADVPLRTLRALFTGEARVAALAGYAAQSGRALVAHVTW
jgi:hypothetical protein